MSLTFVDQQGMGITVTMWRKLYSDLDNRYLKRLKVGEITLELSWVGVVVAGERSPRPFLVRVVPNGAAKRPSGLPREVWCRTQEEGLKALDAMREKIELHNLHNGAGEDS